MRHTWGKTEVLDSRTSGILCLQSPLVLVPSRRWLREPSESGDENGNCQDYMRDLGHEKNSQHVFIKSVILRESFLSGM